MSAVEHTLWSMCLVIPIYYLGNYFGYQRGKEDGVADAIEFFIKKKWFKDHIEKEIVENEFSETDRSE